MAEIVQVIRLFQLVPYIPGHVVEDGAYACVADWLPATVNLLALIVLTNAV